MAIGWMRLAVVDEIVEVLKTAEAGVAADVCGAWGSAKSVITQQTAEQLGCWGLIITATRAEAESSYEDLCTLMGEQGCVLFPAWEVKPEDKMAPSDDIVAERMNALKRLATARERGERIVAVAPVASVVQRVVVPDLLDGQKVAVQVGEDRDLEEMVTALTKIGYRRELMVEQRGEVSVRGGILDVFPISSELPYRIEFFGDTVESIRRFEPETQRSVERVERLDILPRSEKELLRQGAQFEKLALITEYLEPGALVVVDEPLAVAQEAREAERQYGDSPYFASWPVVDHALQGYRRLDVAQLAHDVAPGRVRFNEPMLAVTGWSGNLGAFWQQLRDWDLEQINVTIFCHNVGEKTRLLEILNEQGYRPGYGSFKLAVEIGRFGKGFVSTRDRLAALSEREIFGRHYVRRTRRRFEAGSAIESHTDLHTGDYVVHQTHGIGRFEGIKRFAGKSGDYLSVRYAGGDMLYVPVTRIDLIQRYSAGEGVVPQVDKLGGASWAKKKNKVKKAVRDMAERLVKLYAARQAQPGHAFSPDTPWQNEFEDAFEYDETPDQARAITDVKADLESTKPMDRLICGDVGYGKTEVALRAAFKAVMDGFQVAVLVPTTVLAQQHFATFSERMADFPVRVDVVSRFRTSRENRVVMEKTSAGEVDVVIGTHRILSKDMKFHKLGLVIIDEEQKFGVAQKEKLKEVRTHVDVLTLSATPIPRTLHLSLSGIRDLSVINTAPNDRLPIHTTIDVYEDELVQEAIQRELGREGQVFYLHNRVQTIYAVADQLQKLVPTARIGIAHGQMPEGDLQEVMGSFVRKDINILVCTTIIGAGLDIPNANTIIVDRADRFGLAELYQIRGRVGRYKHRAFAYLLVPGDRVPTEDAQKRLKALEEFSSLGAGFRIAMRDLEIRGAGDILGAEQSGHIVAVGYETYSQLIRESVAELKGQPITKRTLPPFEVAVDAFIPEEYVASETQKMTLYRRIANLMSAEEVQEMTEELQDRFGRLPASVRRLLEVMRVRARGAEAGAKSISAGGGMVKVEFEGVSAVDKTVRARLASRFGKRVEFHWQDTPSIVLTLGAGDEVMDSASRLLAAMLDEVE